MSYPKTVVLTKESETPFKEFLEKIPKIIKETDHSEMFGYEIDPSKPQYNKDIATSIVFKYFKANDYKVEESINQLKASLEWRKEFQPLKAGFGEDHDPKFSSIGFITCNEKSPANLKVVTWNLYGAKAKGMGSQKEYFEDFETFVRWRIGLMEQAISLIDFTDPTNNYIAQIHDYEGVSFLSSDSTVRKTGKAVVQLFQAHYPEFLSTKYFLNFPFVLAWVYNYVVKNFFISPETVKKFHILHSGKDLSKQFAAADLPKKYGGSGKDLADQNVKGELKTEFAKTFLFEEEVNDVD